jgi:serine phosphatase RsbU (regulator of sigma subunit)
MARGIFLPPARTAPARGLAERAKTFFVERWSGRVLLGALALRIACALLPFLPHLVAVLADFVLLGFAVFFAFRLARAALRRLLWRIRTKLLVSYLFIALVPVVLLGLFFLIASFLFVGLVASQLVTAELTRVGQVVKAAAQAAATDLPPTDAAAGAAFASRLKAARGLPPNLAYAFARRGHVVAVSGDVPQTLPAWLKDDEFAGVVRPAKDRNVLRVVWRQGADYAIFDVPMDAALFADLEKQTGLHVFSWQEVRKDLSRHRRHGRKRDADAEDEEEEPDFVFGIDGDEQPEAGAASPAPGSTNPAPRAGLAFVALAERFDWQTGKKEIEPLTFQFQPLELFRRLSPGLIPWEREEKRRMVDVLFYALGALGVVFLVVYAVALLLGVLLARSVTASVHALSVGTNRVRQGDFSHPVNVRSRDQLGELGESFNLMAQGIQDLLREQAEKERLEEELRIARQIQMSLLPAQGAVSLPGLRIAALCLPAAEVGGDYYDLLPLSPTRMGVLVADVSGKGTSAALYMAELKGLVLSLSRIYDSPRRLLAEANRILSANMDARSFITMTYAVVDTAARTMCYARAGHNPIIHLDADTGRTRVLTPPGLGLGIDRGDRFEEILEEAEVSLAEGDLFLFFTDGLSEAMNPEAELFGEGRLRKVIEESEGLESDAIKERILEEIRRFVAGAAQHDDMTLVVLKVVR